MNKLYALSLFSISISLFSMDKSLILYEAHRDKQAIKTILEEYPYLAYESIGEPEGTTEKYLESDKYKTKVLRVDDETVGFVNYLAYDLNFCTFHFGRKGLINLIGVKKQYQGRGYGTTLLTHAMDELKQEKVSNIDLIVLSTNTQAINLYQKRGFSCSVDLKQIKKEGPIPMCYDTQIPTDYSRRGNIVQQYPKLSLAAISLTALAFAINKTTDLGNQ